MRKLLLLPITIFFLLLVQTSFGQTDPDMPDFSKYKQNKEEFMIRRAEAVARLRGIEKDKPLDPKLRMEAIRMMEEQKANMKASKDPNQASFVDAVWTPIGPNPIPNGQVATGPSTPVSGRVSAIAVHPTNANIAYVGTAQGGVYRTTDGGTTWTPILDGAASLAIGAIAIAPSSPEIVYVGTGEATFSGSSFFGVGVYRINNASTTANVSGPFRQNAASADVFSGRAIGRIIVHPTNADIIFVASTSGVGGILGNTTGLTLPSRGIYRCNNATAASPVFAKLTGLLADLNVSVRDIAIDPLNPDILIANPIATGANQGGIYRTTNALAGDPTTVTFTQTHIVNSTSTSELVIEFAAMRLAASPDATFYAASGQGGGRVQKSVNGGATWTQTIANNFCNPQCFYDVAIAVDPTNANNVYLGGSPTLVSARSTDGAVTFTDNRTSVHVDTHVMTVSPSNTSQVWLGTDGGIYKSTDAGLTWGNLNNSTFSATQFMSLALHPTDPVFTIGGTQDNGTNFINPSSVWTRVDGGDGGYTQIDQNAVNTTNVRQYHTYFNATSLQGYGTIATVGSGWSFRGCQTAGATVNGITCNGSINFYAPLERGPGNPNTIYYGSDRLYRSADEGLNHTVVSQNPIAAGVPISAIGISPQNDNVRIVGLNNGGLFGTSTGSTTLVDLDPGNTVPNNLIARTVIDPNSQTTAYVTLSAFNVAGVWKTTNLNAATPTWTAVATGLPQVPVDAIVIDPSNSSNVYVGTDIGVYASTNGGASWAPFGTGLPVVAVFGIGITASPKKLRVATHGRGMWDNPLTATNPTVTINQAAAQPDPTSASPINFTVVFDQPVINFATGDVTLSGTAGATLGTVTGGPTTYNVAVSGMTTNGTVIATIAAGVCTNAALENNNASTSTDNTVTFNLPATPPTVTINQAAAQADPTSTSPINFTVVFDQPVTGFTTGDVTLSGTAGATLGTVTGGPTTYNVAVSGMTGSGTVIATIAAGVCQNASAQTNTASTSTDNTVTYNLPATPPTVTINQAAAQLDPTSALPINFTVVFDQSVTGFATGDVTISGTAPGTPVATVTGGPVTYNVAVTGLTGSGTVIASIAAGVCQNAAAQPNLASTSTDNTVTYNAPAVCTNVNQVPNQTVCHLSPTAAVNFTSGTPGTTFSWVNNNTSIGLAASGSGPTIASFIGTNPTTAPVTATITVTPTLTTVTATTTTFNFTGGAQTFTVPAGVSSIDITTLGAQGGTGATGGNGATGGVGGLGSRATGTLAVTPGQVLTIFVGGQGGSPTSGFNGGGTGGNANSGGGGGASDVRFPGAASADRILVAGGGGGGGRAGCEPNTVNGGAGGNGDGNGANGVTSPNGGGGFGAIGTTAGGAGIGCAGFLGSPGLAGFGPAGGNGGAGQSCCCFSFASVPGGGGGGGGFLGGAGGGGGSAGTTGCLGNDKGGGGGGAGGISNTGGVTAGVITTGIQTGNGQVVLNYNVTVVCTGPTMGFTITVNPTPVVNPIPNQVVCQNAPTAPVNFTGTPVGTVFQWTNNTPAIGLAASGTGNIPSFIALNPTALPLVATITVTPATGLATPIVTTYNFTGAVQTFTVPAGITSVNLKTWGAQGNSNAGGIVGGLGGYAEGNLTVVPGQVLNVMVGGGATTSINGGYNGGGAAGINGGCAAAQGGGGGGASDVRIAPYALANRVLVGAGGGGAGGNRTAGCGRGTGGGGGGGLWGGGGGAGWPGVPPGGPVPTGGTQVAGGAAGVTTWTGGGPTNGFPGVLAVGGAGGIEVGSPQGTPTGPAEQGGVGGGATGGSGLYNSANNWNGHSGAGGSSYIGGVTGGITTAGLRTGAGQVQVTYTPISAATCFGVARTFTITVNPNANLIIVADPGTTICEGDPTLLTVYDAGAVSAPGILYTQGTGTPANGSPSQVFEPANAAFSSQGADDFTIPSGGLWSITQITANGIGTGTPTSVNVFFYANSGANLPGAAIASFTNITTFTRVGGNYTVTLPSAVALGGGTYWMSFQVNMSFAAGGQWFWGNFGTTNVGNQYAWQNPGGGFGTPCTSWGYGATGCAVGGALRNNIFSVIGTSVALGPQSTGTFLWSPALGLSSTTSNPVAASPMNTTTYTVVRTTVPGGCTASAMVTITVNKRPVVTTQPANTVRCVGNTATFTVGATGTGLTYQWQESLTGCPGTVWSNLNNGGNISGATSATLSIANVTQLMSGRGYRCIVNGTCTPFIPPTNVSNCATLTVNPNPVVAITPAGPVCGGVAGISGTALSTATTPPPVPGSVSVNSGTINLAVPDNTANGVSNVIAMAGVPANATITNVSVTFNNFSHTYPGDMIIHLQAPNGQILNLYKYGTGLFTGPASGVPTWGWYGAKVSQTGTTAWSTVATAPFIYNSSTAWRADALNTPVVGATIQNPTGFVSAATNFAALYTTPASTTGNWTLAMCDGGPGDVGTLTSWGLTIDYTTPGTSSSTLSYLWAPVTGLYTNSIATTAYTGQNLSTVYAAPTTLTTYTVTATDVVTGCFSTASVLVNYTPPAPTVTPSSVTMCLGDPAVRLTSSSATSTTVQFCSGPISVIVPDNNAAGATSNITVSGIPAACNVSAMSVNFNMSHTWAGDVAIALRAPNGNILNLDYYLSNTGGTGATTGFTNTTISSTGTAALSSVGSPYTGTFRADAITTPAPPVNGPTGPTGNLANVNNWNALYSVPNGVWTLAMVDAFNGDQGTLTSWCINMTYVCGVPSTAATWSPIAGLFINSAATLPYTGDARDTVWTMPTPAGVYPYQVTVQSVPAFLPVPPAFTNPAAITINGVGNGTPYPSNLVVAGLPTTGVSVQSVTLTGLNHTWSDDIDVLLQSPNSTNVILMSDVGGAAVLTPRNYTFQDGAPAMGTAANAGGTYRPTNLVGAIGVEPDNWPAPGPGAVAQAAPALSMFGSTADMNGTWKLFVVDDAAGDAGSISGGYTIRFNVPVAPCTSPARTVVVTVNAPTVINAAIPVNQTICTDKVATFSTAVVSGTGPHTYQWQVSVANGPFTNVANGGVYSGATTATLTITAPPVSFSTNRYQCVVTGAAPCAAQTSRIATLVVNPLPVIVISATAPRSLLPGLTSTFTSTVTPNPAATYSWIRNGVVLNSPALGVVSGLGTGSIVVDVDGQGDYQLRVTDVNGCTNISNTVNIKDSASGKCYIYPNPTSGKFQVRYYSVANNVLPRSLTIFDAKGDRVMTQFYTIGMPYDRMDVDMRAFGKGLYWVEIGDRNGNRLTMCRVVIQ